MEKIATEIYGADGVDWSREAQEKLNRVEADSDNVALGICMVKTHLSLSHDPMLKGAPKGWRLPIQEDLLIYRGASFLVPVAGDIKLMPGTGSNPGFRRIDVDTDTGKILTGPILIVVGSKFFETRQIYKLQNRGMELLLSEFEAPDLH